MLIWNVFTQVCLPIFVLMSWMAARPTLPARHWLAGEAENLPVRPGVHLRADRFLAAKALIDRDGIHPISDVQPALHACRNRRTAA